MRHPYTRRIGKWSICKCENWGDRPDSGGLIQQGLVKDPGCAKQPKLNIKNPKEGFVLGKEWRGERRKKEGWKPEGPKKNEKGGGKIFG